MKVDTMSVCISASCPVPRVAHGKSSPHAVGAVVHRIEKTTLTVLRCTRSVRPATSSEESPVFMPRHGFQCSIGVTSTADLILEGRPKL